MISQKELLVSIKSAQLSWDCHIIPIDFIDSDLVGIVLPPGNDRFSWILVNIPYFAEGWLWLLWHEI